MENNLEKFLELYSSSREDDSWDFKEKIELNSKSQKYNFIKDLLAMSNFGGGYILIGVNKDNRTIIDVEIEHDPANVGTMVEKNLGFGVLFNIGYFYHDFGQGTKKVGLISVLPSPELLVCPFDLQIEDGKTIVVRENDILYRRNTRSIKANRQDIEKIYERIKKNQSKEIGQMKIADIGLISQNHSMVRTENNSVINIIRK